MMKPMNKDQSCNNVKILPDLFKYGNPILNSSLKHVLNMFRFAEAFHLTCECEAL